MSYIEFDNAFFRGELVGATGEVDVVISDDLEASTINFTKGSVTFDEFIDVWVVGKTTGQTIVAMAITIPDNGYSVLLTANNGYNSSAFDFVWYNPGAVILPTAQNTLGQGFYSRRNSALVYNPGAGVYTVQLRATGTMDFIGILRAHYIRPTGSLA